jgi:adenylate cyclase
MAADASGSQIAPSLRALDELLFPRAATYTATEVAAGAEIDLGIAIRLWAAMGFAAAPLDESIFMDDDLEALMSAAQALRDGIPVDDVVYQTRVAAAALARVAEVNSDQIVARIAVLRDAGVGEDDIAELVTGGVQPDIDRMMGYFYRRQLKAALWRKLAGADPSSERVALTVAFVDLVRFTAITEDIAEDQLAELIDRFETTVHDRVTAGGGRIVKMIGDEVMFVSDAADLAVDTALELVGAFQRDDAVPQARAGLASGAVLGHGGDFFGPVVNLAARIVDVARPSTVVVSGPLHDDLGDRTDLGWRRLPPKRLKGIGRTALWAVSARALE